MNAHLRTVAARVIGRSRLALGLTMTGKSRVIDPALELEDDVPQAEETEQ